MWVADIIPTAFPFVDSILKVMHGLTVIYLWCMSEIPNVFHNFPNINRDYGHVLRVNRSFAASHYFHNFLNYNIEKNSSKQDMKHLLRFCSILHITSHCVVSKTSMIFDM